MCTCTPQTKSKQHPCCLAVIIVIVVIKFVSGRVTVMTYIIIPFIIESLTIALFVGVSLHFCYSSKIIQKSIKYPFDVSIKLYELEVEVSVAGAFPFVLSVSRHVGAHRVSYVAVETTSVRVPKEINRRKPLETFLPSG